jgi:pyruvate/2-oxoglutarate dehydrogenase complex dihydrolipoamide acyltransferase (E2) component
MIVKLTEQRTLEGFTYEIGGHDVPDETGRSLLSNFPAVCKQVTGGPEDVPPPIEETESEGQGGEVMSSSESTNTPAPTEEINATIAAIELAEQEGIDLSNITGTGSGGRITKADVEDWIAENTTTEG